MATVRRYGLRIRKLADKSHGRRVAADGTPMEAWPLLGVMFVDPPAEHLRIPSGVIIGGYREGWIDLENPENVSRPAGPPHAPWAGKAGTDGVNHTFLHASTVTFHTVDGDYVYKVAANPDKQHPNRVVTGGDVEGGDVSHVYDLDLVQAPKKAA